MRVCNTPNMHDICKRLRAFCVRGHAMDPVMHAVARVNLISDTQRQCFRPAWVYDVDYVLQCATAAAL
jgi:hypothetical protein